MALHAFDELNGRVTRLYFDLPAIQNGCEPIDHKLAWQDDAEVGNNHIRASIDCVQRADHRLLTQMILAGLNPLQDDEA
jgi:cell filamentation protein